MLDVCCACVGHGFRIATDYHVRFQKKKKTLNKFQNRHEQAARFSISFGCLDSLKLAVCVRFQFICHLCLFNIGYVLLCCFRFCACFGYPYLFYSLSLSLSLYMAVSCHLFVAYLTVWSSVGDTTRLVLILYAWAFNIIIAMNVTVIDVFEQFVRFIKHLLRSKCMFIFILYKWIKWIASHWNF